MDFKDNKIIRGAASCPCSNPLGATRAPWNKTTTPATTTKATTTKATTTKATTTKATTTKATTTQSTTTKASTLVITTKLASTTTTTKSTTTTSDDTCPLGADISGAPRGEITWYSEEPTGGNCDFNWDNLKNSGLDGWISYGALTKSSNSALNRYENSKNCGRCARLR